MNVKEHPKSAILITHGRKYRRCTLFLNITPMMTESDWPSGL